MILSTKSRHVSTSEQVALSDMPQISIGNTRENSRYGLNADNTFWVKQGIIAVQNLKNSDDEEIIADILISILLDEPFARSKENLDTAYDLDSELYSKIEAVLIHYTPKKLKDDVQNTFSVLMNCIEQYCEN